MCNEVFKKELACVGSATETLTAFITAVLLMLSNKSE